MTPEKLITLIEQTEGIKTVEQIPVNPYDENEVLLLITFENEKNDRN